MQLTKKCPKYAYRKEGVYYFSNAVPKDLLDLYCKPRIVKCRGTRSPQSAQFVATATLAKLEDYWLGVRLKRMEVPAAELLVHAAEGAGVMSKLSPLAMCPPLHRAGDKR